MLRALVPFVRPAIGRLRGCSFHVSLCRGANINVMRALYSESSSSSTIAPTAKADTNIAEDVAKTIPIKIFQPVLVSRVEELATDEEYEKYKQSNADEAAENLSSADLSSLSLADFKNGFSYHTMNNDRFTIGVVRDKEGEEIAKVVRNLYDLHSWVEKDGETYLITAEDYQGLTVINCNQKWKHSYTPKASAKGIGFCFSSAAISPNGKFLLVHGCIWACPYEIRIYKFDNPTQLPYKLVAIIGEEEFYDVNTQMEWIDNTFFFRVSSEVLKMEEEKEQKREEIQNFIESLQADCEVQTEIGEEWLTFKFMF